jgi:hypothetical protein
VTGHAGMRAMAFTSNRNPASQVTPTAIAVGIHGLALIALVLQACRKQARKRYAGRGAEHSTTP